MGPPGPERSREAPRQVKTGEGGPGGGKIKEASYFTLCMYVCTHAHINVASQFICPGLNSRTRNIF